MIYITNEARSTELVMIISYPASPSRIIVLLKTPTSQLFYVEFIWPFSSEQRDRQAWGEFTNPRENDPNKMAEGRKENTNRTYLLSIFTAKEGPMCD